MTLPLRVFPVSGKICSNATPNKTPPDAQLRYDNIYVNFLLFLNQYGIQPPIIAIIVNTTIEDDCKLINLYSNIVEW